MAKVLLKATVEPEKSKQTPLVRELEPMKGTKVSVNVPILIVALAIMIAGGITGFVLAGGGKTGGTIGEGITSAGGFKKVVGVEDEKTFKDSTEGVIREGGIDGEGSHHLERPGGESQNVYLTSSTVPLDDYIGKKVKVWGETFAAEKAGWFMDVGRLELLE